MAEYRKRKQVQSMPRQVPKSKQSSDDGVKSTEDQNGKGRDEVEKQIEEQQKSSIMKVFFSKLFYPVKFAFLIELLFFELICFEV